ncbi:MAG: hypothetical protein KKE50_03675 [Nanoarchaeota archaeon]|nr:hypothetical protein [Nanoarchaeota archaeon]
MKRGRLFLFGIFLIILLASFSSAGILKVTEEHPFLVNGEWVPAKNLNEGDLLKTADGKSARIKSIKWVPGIVEVFNLEAGYFHNFILSDGLVVHNSGSVGKNIVQLKIPGVGDYSLVFHPYAEVSKPIPRYTIAVLSGVEPSAGKALFLGKIDPFGSVNVEYSPLKTIFTYPNRQGHQIQFLIDNPKIDSVAVFGAANVCGAPFAQEVAIARPDIKTIFAFDVVGPIKTIGRVELKQYNIVNAPLSQKVKAIQWENAAYYLTPQDSQKALRNIWDSLDDGGYLFGADGIFKKAPDYSFDYIAIRDTSVPTSPPPYQLTYDFKICGCKMINVRGENP